MLPDLSSAVSCSIGQDRAGMHPALCDISVRTELRCVQPPRCSKRVGKQSSKEGGRNWWYHNRGSLSRLAMPCSVVLSALQRLRARLLLCRSRNCGVRARCMLCVAGVEFDTVRAQTLFCEHKRSV